MIAYLSTSVSDADAPAAGILTQDAIRDNLLDHASGAWTLVEEFNSSGSTIHWVVVKNDGSLSDVGVDFYVVIGRLAATGQIGIFLGENYNAGSNTLDTFAPRAGAYYENSILADHSYSTGGGSTASFVLGTSFPSGAVGQPICPVPTAAPTMRYISMVEKDYAIFAINGTVIYVGALIDDIVPAAGLDAAVPLGCFNLFDTGYPGFGSLTRHPIAAADAPMAVTSPFVLLPIWNDRKTFAQAWALSTGVWLHPDRFQDNRVAASELYALMVAGVTGGNANNGAEKTGLIRGRFKNLRVATFPAAVVQYDLIVVDGRKAIVLGDKNQLDSGIFVTPNGYYTDVKWGFVCDTGVVA